MAKKSYKKTYPKLRWVLLLAIAISIPVTIWTFNTAPTETRSNAATAACTTNGGACYKYSCPTSGSYFSISGTCGTMADSVCCRKLTAPTGLDGYAWYCMNSGVEKDAGKFIWKSVPYATSYTIFTRPYSSDNRYTYKAWPVGNTTYKIIDPVYSGTTLNKRAIDWKVRVYHDGVYRESARSITNVPKLSCPQ